MEIRDTVTPWQMSVLLFAFMTGSSIVFVPGILVGFAHNGAWISLLVSMSASLALIGCVAYLHRRHEGLTYVQYSRKTVGKLGAAMLAAPLALYLTLIVAWVTMGVSDFMNSTSMRNTPPYVFHSLILATAAMTVRSGFEVMTRITVLQIGILLFFVVCILVLSAPNYNPDYLLPVLPEGLLPVLHGSYFTYGFPHAEVVVFAMLLYRTKHSPHAALRNGLFVAVLANGILLLVSTLCAIMVFGPVTTEMKYSLFGVSRLIDIGEFFQRIESVIGISLIAGSYLKTTIALYALNALVTQLFRLKDEKLLVLPLTAICFLTTLVMFENDAEFIAKFTEVLPVINVFCAVLPLLLVFALSVIRKS